MEAGIYEGLLTRRSPMGLRQKKPKVSLGQNVEFLKRILADF